MAEDTNNSTQQNAEATEQQSTQQNAQPAFDYEKLAQIVTGRQSATEESVLKGYFKQQGLTQEEMTQAIESFKEQKKANTPDVGALQSQLSNAQAMLQKQSIEHEATMQAVSLGVDIKTIPYLLRMTDLSSVTVENGIVNAESVTEAIKKTLEDVPGLKPTLEETKGFKFGAGNNEETPKAEDMTRKRFGLK